MQLLRSTSIPPLNAWYEGRFTGPRHSWVIILLVSNNAGAARIKKCPRQHCGRELAIIANAVIESSVQRLVNYTTLLKIDPEGRRLLGMPGPSPGFLDRPVLLIGAMTSEPSWAFRITELRFI